MRRAQYPFETFPHANSCSRCLNLIIKIQYDTRHTTRARDNSARAQPKRNADLAPVLSRYRQRVAQKIRLFVGPSMARATLQSYYSRPFRRKSFLHNAPRALFRPTHHVAPTVPRLSSLSPCSSQCPCPSTVTFPILPLSRFHRPYQLQPRLLASI